MSDGSSSNWIDQELRRVPLPDGLLERLRRLGRLADDELDRALAEAPLPPGLMERLLAIVDDERLDAAVCDVSVPEGLLEDLQFIPYEDRLRDVPVPVDLLLELRRIPPRPRRRLPAAQVALAASLLLMITAGYVLSMTGLVLTAYDRLAGPQVAVIPLDEAGLDLTSPVAESEAVAIAAADVSADRREVDRSAVAFRDVLEPPPHAPAIAEQLDHWIGPKHRLTDNILPIKYGILGHLDNTDDRMPNLELLSGPQSRGIEPPVALGFDRQFLITQRTQPVVSLEHLQRIAELSPGEDVDLLLDGVRHSRLPLWTRTASFDHTRRLAGRGRLPSPQEIHVEDFLAAMDFHYAPAEPRELALRVFGGPSVFGAEGARLMQVGVQAGGTGLRESPLRVTFVVDISQSMRWSGRWETVRQALARMPGQLTSEDRLSLIVFNDAAHTLLEDAWGNDRERLATVLDRLAPAGATNIGAGLQEAAVLAADRYAEPLPASATPLHRRHVVVISDGTPPAPDDVARQINGLIEEIARSGAKLHVVDVGGWSEGDAGLRQIAQMAGGEPLLADDAQQLHLSLSQRLIGQSPLVAEEAVLRVSFNPKAVQAYRLLGHETTTVGGTLTAPVESTIAAGQSSTALYEVWLHPDGEARVAEVEVAWRDPADHRQHVRRQEVRRVQFVPSLREAGLPLQAAAIAAEAAEVLRQSPFAGRSRDLGEVLALAEEVNPRLAQRESFQRYVQVLRQAAAARRGGTE